MSRLLMWCVLLIAGSVAMCAEERREAVMLNMPFDFLAVDRALPAGGYYFWSRQKNKTLMWAQNGREVMELSTVPVLRPVATAEPKMFFVVIGSQKRLWRYFPPRANDGVEFAVPGLALRTNQAIPKTMFVSDKASLMHRYFARQERIIVGAAPKDARNVPSTFQRPAYRRNY